MKHVCSSLVVLLVVLLAGSAAALAETPEITPLPVPAAIAQIEVETAELGKSLGLPAKPGEVLEIDSRSYAADTGVSIDEAVRRLRLQAHLGKITGLLKDATGERFAGLWFEHHPEYRIVVRLAGDAPTPFALKSAVSESIMPITFVTGGTATLAELTELIDASIDDLLALVPGLAGTEVDVRTGEIVLTLEKNGTDGQWARDRAEQIEAWLGQPVRFDMIDAPAGDGHTRGGANLSTCTSGFSVNSGSGCNGFITAGHCGDTQTYYEFGGTSYAATFQSEIRDANQDVQWHTTSHIEYPQFYASSTSTYRTLTGQVNRSSQSAGNYVCHRGKTTGYSCGYIDTTSYRPTWANACNGVTCSSTWIKVSGGSLECYPGDSGGPWFNGYNAYGIYKGQSSSGTTSADCNWAVYMAIDYAGISLCF